jgi:hypothetical protein
MRTASPGPMIRRMTSHEVTLAAGTTIAQDEVVA